MTEKKLLKIVLLVLIAALFVAVLASCSAKDEKDATLLSVSDIKYLAEIQETTGNLTFEWLNGYNSNKPTLIVVHGEVPGQSSEKFTINLDAGEYSFKTTDNPTDYVVAENIGYKAQGLDLEISKYWLNVADYNVAIFHWEKFADETYADEIVAKIFSVPKMRYALGNNVYETSRVPKYSLAEVFGALYFNEMADKQNGKEVRIVGNGVGADLALAGTHYLYSFVQKSQLDKNILPSRITLCDPYLSGSDLNLKMPWGNFDVTHGTLGIYDVMTGDFSDFGVAMEMVESLEVSTVDVIENEQHTTKTIASYAYGNEEKSEIDEKHFDSIKGNLAYLALRESYSNKFSDDYKAQKRIALDWYLYSIIGSDDSGNAGANAASGYPRAISDYHSYYSNSGFNWSDKETRPLVNNRQLNNDYSSSYAQYKGKNYALSAWTPTIYARGLKGVSFEMKKYLSTTTLTDIHGNPTYNYSDYTMAYFRSENFQVSDQDYTLICGYVYTDANSDLTMNEGRNGIANVNIAVAITATIDGATKDVASYDVKTDDTGFYMVRLDDKVVDEDGNESTSGYSFVNKHSVKLTVEPVSHDYMPISGSATGIYYLTMNQHNFSGYTCTVSVDNYLADSVLVRNCLLKKG